MDLFECFVRLLSSPRQVHHRLPTRKVPSPAHKALGQGYRICVKLICLDRWQHKQMAVLMGIRRRSRPYPGGHPKFSISPWFSLKLDGVAQPRAEAQHVLLHLLFREACPALICGSLQFFDRLGRPFCDPSVQGAPEVLNGV